MSLSTMEAAEFRAAVTGSATDIFQKATNPQQVILNQQQQKLQLQLGSPYHRSNSLQLPNADQPGSTPGNLKACQ